MHFIVFSSSSLFVKQTRSYRHCDSGFKEWDSMLYNGEVKWSEVAQLCPTLCDSVNCSLPGSSIHGIFQAGVLEWDAISFSRGSSLPRDWTWVSCIVGRRLNIWATREVQLPLSPSNRDLACTQTICWTETNKVDSECTEGINAKKIKSSLFRHFSK